MEEDQGQQRWAEQLRSHPAHASIVSLRNALSAASARDGLSDDQTGLLGRIGRMADFVQARLRTAAPALAAPNTVNGIRKQTDAATTHTRNFASSGSEAELNNAITTLGGAIANASSLPMAADRSSLEGALQEVVSGFQSEVEALSRRGNSATDVVEQKATDLEAKLAELNQKTQGVEARVDSVVSDFQSQFSQNENSRGERFAASEKARNEQFQTLLDEARREREENEANLKGQAQTTLDRLNKFHEEASQLVGAIGQLGTTYSYKEQANADWKAANWMRRGAVTLGLLLVGIVVYTAVTVSDVGWSVVLFRFMAALIIGGPAAYLAVESARHRAAARRNRRLQLELAAIEPFIALLDEEKKKALKEQMSHRYFKGEDLDSPRG